MAASFRFRRLPAARREKSARPPGSEPVGHLRNDAAQYRFGVGQVLVEQLPGIIVQEEEAGASKGRLRSDDASGGGETGIAPVAEPDKTDIRILPNAAAGCQRNPPAPGAGHDSTLDVRF